MKVGVLGANGFLGSEMVRVLGEDHTVVSLTRDNYLQYKGTSFDVFINMAGNNKNYWANKFPQEDFKGSALLVYDNLFDFKIDKYVFMSSIATYDINSHYGFNKTLAEEIIRRHSNNYLIFRCSATIDRCMKIGILNDILKGIPLFISGDSQIQFITRNAVANIIKDLMSTDVYNRTFNMGGVGAVTISSIESIVGHSIIYDSAAKKRHYEMDVCELNELFKLKTSYEYVEDIV